MVGQLQKVLDKLQTSPDGQQKISAIRATLVAELTNGIMLPPGYSEKVLHLSPTYSAHARFQHRQTTKLGQLPLFYTSYKPGTKKQRINSHLEAALVGWFLGDTASAVLKDSSLAHNVTKHYTFTDSGETEDLTHFYSGAHRKTASLDYKHCEVEHLLHARYPALLRQMAKADLQ